MKIGCVGLGLIGGSLARNLVRAGHDVTVHDVDRRAAEQLIAAGASWADSPAKTAFAAEAVITCLPSVPAAIEVVSGVDGLREGLAPGSVWIEMGTTDPHELIRLAALLAECGVDTLEAPVTGGVHNASSGTLAVFVGGEETIFHSLECIFHAIGNRVFYVGELGKASRLKLISNMLAFVHIVASAEAFMLCRRSEIDLRLAWEALRASSGDSFILGTESTTILSGSYDVGFSFDLCLKDLGLALSLGRELGVPLDIASMVEQTFIRGRTCYGGAAPYAMVAKLLEEVCNVDLRAAGFPETLEQYLAFMPRAAVEAESDDG